MHFKLRDHMSHRGEGTINEDQAGVNDHLAWIIDGATDLNPVAYFPGSTDARWVVDQVNTKLYEVSADSTPYLSKEIYQQLARHVRHELTKVDYPPDRILPSCSCGIARLDPDCEGVQLSLVGAVSTNTLLSNAYFSGREAAGVQRARSRLGTSKQAVSPAYDRHEIARRRQQYIVGIDGNVVLSANEEALETGVQEQRTSARLGDLFLLCTDGFARLIHPYGIYRSWPELASEIVAHGLDVALKKLRHHEVQHLSPYDSYKTSDDACAMLISIEENAT